MQNARPPAVAGQFYPADAAELARSIDECFDDSVPAAGKPVPKAIIAPHAGYIYSGPIAASVYQRLERARGRIARVVLMGPSHRVPFRGVALCTAAAYDTPLGPVPIDRAAEQEITGLPGVTVLDAAHAEEHSLEVHLPFLVRMLGDFCLVPLVAGDAEPEVVAGVLDRLWGGPETLIVISSDLSHYLGYEQARQIDQRTADAIERLDPSGIGHDQACGRVPIGGLLELARRCHLRVERIDLRNSGDTAGDRRRVVGYGAWAFCE